MANDKKFIVKNGLQSQENVVIGSSTDNGVNKLQVTGSSKFTGAVEITQATQATPTVKFTNSGGPASLIAEFVGDSSSVQITNVTPGDYAILNTGQSNGIKLYNNAAGMEILYNNAVDMSFNSAGIDFKREPTYQGSVFWNAGNDGAGSGLDADLIDGLDSLQFVRADQDDTLDGNYIITGNLTVQGTTTTINTETVLIADNLLTLNSNFTTGAPTENAGWEVLRGDEAVSSLQWDETADYFKLISDGTDLGRIITTADEAVNGGSFDAATLDGLDSTQFLRSDVDDTAAGNITIQGDLTVGDGNGFANIKMDGAGTNGTISSSAGEIGFLNSAFAFGLKLNAAGDVEVKDDIYAQKFIDINNNTYQVVPSVTSVLNNIDLEGALRHNGDTDTFINFPATGRIGFTLDNTQYGLMTDASFQYIGDMIADRFLDRSNNAYYVDPASSSVLNTIGIDSDLFHNGNATTKLAFGTNTIDLHTNGSSRLTIADAAVTSTVDVIAPRFVDSNNNSFFLDPASTSELNSANFYSGVANNTINIGSSVNERIEITTTPSQSYFRYYQNETNNTDHSVNFQIISSGNGLNRFNFNKEINAGGNNIVGGLGVFSAGVYGSIYYDYDDETYFADFNNTGNSINMAGTIEGGNGTAAAPTYTFGSDTNTGMFRGAADRLDFSAGGNVELQVLTTYASAPGSFRAPIFYDLNNTAYYGDFAGTSQMSRIDIDDYIRHRGDTDNYFGFGATDTFRVWTGATQRLNIDNNSADFSVDVTAPNVYAARFYDSGNNAYYADPASTSVLNNISINDYVIHNGDTNTYFGFDAADQFGVWANGIKQVNIDVNSADFTQSVYAPSFYTNDYLIHNGDTNTYIGFDAVDQFGIWANGVKQVNIDVNSADFTQNVIAPNVGINADLFHNGDTDTKLSFGTNTIDLQTGGASRLAIADAQVTAKVPVDVTLAVTLGGNPFAATNKFMSFGDATGTDFTIAGDSSGNANLITDNNFIVYDSSASGKFAVLSDGVVAGGDSFINANPDATTNFIATPAANKFHSAGGISIEGKDSLLSIYNADGANTAINEATFLGVNELGFSAGGGFYMNETTTMYVRGNKALYTTGNMFGARFYDADNNSYYVDPASTSVMNRIDLDDYIRHNGDTNTYFGFAANDTFRVFTGGTQRLNIDNNSADFAVNVYGPRFYDSNDNNYYLDPAADSQLNTIDIDDYVRHRGNTDAYFGWAANNNFKLFTNGVERINVDANSADFAVNVYAPRYYDSDDTTYYVDPASVSIMNNVSFGAPANGSTVKGRFLSIEGSTDASGEGSGRIFFAEHNASAASQDRYGMSLAYQGGSTSITSVTGQPVTLNGTSNGTWALIGHDDSVNGTWAMRGPRNASYVEARAEFRAPLFRDSNNTAYYVDPASTSVTNIMRANQYQVDGATVYIDSRSGDYGSIKVEGTTASGSWAGYAIRDDWVFMSNGATTAGIYNDTRNEWALEATDNSWTRLYANGVHQIGAENGYGFAPTSMRSPIFYDSNNTAYYGNFAAGNTGQSLKINGRIFREGFNTSGGGADNWYLNAQDANQFIWNTTTNWGIFWATNTSAAYRHAPFGDNMISFVGAGNVRAAIDLDSGDAYFQNEVYAANYNLAGGNEAVSLNPAYGSGLADTMMFDGTIYWEKRVIQGMKGIENPATTSTAEYVKNGNGPFAATHALRTAAYRTFDSDFIEVEPGEEIYGEISVRRISGSGGLLYMGVRRYDKDKRAIAGNDGIEYFVVGGNNQTSTSWQTFSGHTTIPTTHTPFGGSDGAAVKYVRLIVLMNYNAGGALREFGPPILKRVNVQSKLVTEFDLTVGGNAAITGDLTVDDITADVIDARNFRDRDNTARFMNPATGGNVQGTWNWNNGTIDNLNNLTFADPGPNEGIQWKGGNDWRIYESPDNLTTNSGGNLQFVTGATVRARINTSGDITAGRYSYAQRFYDSNNGAYYGDFASTSVFNQAQFTNSTPLRFTTTSTAIFDHESNSTPVAFQMNKGGSTLNDSGSFGVLQLSRTNHNNAATGAGAGLYFVLKDSAGTQREYAGIYGRKTVAGASGGELVFMNYARNEVAYMNSDYFYHTSDVRSPIFYDSNNTGYYGDFASTSNVNILRAQQLQLDGSTYIIDSPSGDYGSIRVDGAKNGWAGYAIRDDWAFMSSGAGNAGIYNDTNNEWALLAAQNSDVQIFFNGTWEERSRSGYMEARGSYRAPIFYDSNNTAYRIDGNGTSRLLTLNVDNVIGGSVNGYASYLLRDDNRIISPSEDPAGRLQFGFTSWANNNTAPWADYLHLRSYTDASGGSDNLVTFKKSGIGMRIWQQSWGSGTAYSTYRNVGVYNENPGGGNNFYASVFYDANDTSYYVDPNGTSFIKQLDVASVTAGNSNYTAAAIEVREYNYGGAQADNYAIAPRIGFHWGGRVASQIALASNGEIRILNNPGNATENFRARIVYADVDARAPIFYDNNNTAYRGDFASTSRMNRLDVDSINIMTRGNFISFYNDTSNNHAIGARNASGTATDDIRINTYGSLFVNLDSNNNNSSSADFRIGRHGSGTGSIAQLGLFDVYGDALYAYSAYSFRSPIFYDSNNTSYYTNPASTSVMNQIDLAGRLNVDSPQDYSSVAGVTSLTNAPISTRNYDVNVGTTNTYLPLTHQTALYNSGYRTHVSTGLYKVASGWGDNNTGWYVALGGNDSFPTKHWKLTYGTELFNSDGFVSQSGSFRAPIFYDSNNTAYYFDGASVNSTRFEGVSNRTKAMINLSGQTRNSAEYYSARPRITGDTNYWTGSMGWGRQDMNVVGTWGSGFIDSWSNPPNQPAGTSHWVGTQAFHYNVSNTQNTGWQMVGGPIENLRFRSAWAGWRSWRTIPVLGVNSNNDAAMYASIYYDSNNTGYYCDPSSFSNFNTGVRATDIYARNWFRNDGAQEGIYNQATGVHAYSWQGQYYAITGNNNSSSMSLQLRAAFNGTMCRWMYGDRTWSGDLNAAGQWQLQTRHQDGYSPTLRFIESGNESWTGNIGNDAGKIEYHSNRFYIEAGGNSNRIVQFRRNGSDRSYVDNNGLYVGTATSARWADLAERYSADDMYDNATVMGMNLNGDSEITKYEPGMPLVGVISTNPAVQMNDMGIEPGSNSKKARMNPFIALKGRIPCKVSQPVKKGQWVIPDADGKAKGVDYGTPGINSYEIIGIALSDSENGEVEVKV